MAAVARAAASKVAASQQGAAAHAAAPLARRRRHQRATPATTVSSNAQDPRHGQQVDRPHPRGEGAQILAQVELDGAQFLAQGQDVAARRLNLDGVLKGQGGDAHARRDR